MTWFSARAIANGRAVITGAASLGTAGANLAVRDRAAEYVSTIGGRPTEFLIVFLILALLVGGMLLTTGDGDDEPRVRLSSEEVGRVAERVEDVRGLRFERRPRPRVVSSEEARREAVRELERSYPPRRRHADEDLLKLLGLIEPDDSLRSIEEAIFSGQVAGYYDTRRKRLSLVEDVSGTDAVTLELTLAHELTHALEDARFDLKEPAAGADDRATAYAALVEGTAVVVEQRYAERHVDATAQLTAALSQLGTGALGDFEDLPEYFQAALLFPYLRGASFVERLHDAGDGWRLVNAALDERPPVSTEQVLHPEKYLSPERPVRLRLRTGDLLGGRWQRASGGTIGEFDTRELLRRGAEETAARAAAGWAGGRYELWRSRAGAPRRCAPPCRNRLTLLVAWAWDTAKDADEFEDALRGYLADGLEAVTIAGGRWSIGGAWAAVESGERTTVLAFAPSADLATRLAESGLRGAPAG